VAGIEPGGNGCSSKSRRCGVGALFSALGREKHSWDKAFEKGVNCGADKHPKHQTADRDQVPERAGFDQEGS
jgi:hypothetical protein